MIKINFSLCYGVLLGPLAASTSHFRIFTIKANVRVAPRVHHTFFITHRTFTLLLTQVTL